MKKYTKKISIFTLITSVVVVISGCKDVESVPSNDLYRVISEKNMPSYCKHDVAKYFGTYSGNIFLYPIEYSKGAKLIYGKYRVDSENLKRFVCVFNPNDTYAGIKIENSQVSTKLCYPE
ncbi:hypothetical protein MNB_SV-5-1515 [hydrothermal vent metagenome]|uniref:Lipoprotein n=1 Tax=hydrothermal vent metagenome TaxID=652676 RepID=A0A1W1EER1_9ZZZZ